MNLLTIVQVLNALTSFGVKLSEWQAVVDKARAEGREVNIDDVRVKLAQLESSIDEARAAIARVKSDPVPPGP